MSDIMMAYYSPIGTNLHTSADKNSSRSSLESPRAAIYVASGSKPVAASSLLASSPPDVTLLEAVPVRNHTVVESTIRRLTKEIEVAKAELTDLEQTIRQELAMPSVREWLLPLMAVGLALSFYGSFTSANSAELGATGLMLLWSLSAFWFIYTREKRLEMAREASRAEIEIWSSRIEELQRSIEQNQRMIEPVRDDEMNNG